MCIRERVIAKFMQMGEMHAINDVIDFDTASLLAEEFHAKVEQMCIRDRDLTREFLQLGSLTLGRIIFRKFPVVC